MNNYQDNPYRKQPIMVGEPQKPTEPVQQAGTYTDIISDGGFDARDRGAVEQAGEPVATLLKLIESDSFAVSFQTLGQYRKSLSDCVRAIRPAPVNVLTDELKVELRGIAERLRKVPFIEVPASADTEINNIVIDLDVAIDKLNALEGE